MSFLKKLAIKGLARGKVASDNVSMSRRNFLKGMVAGGASKAVNKVEDAVNPTPKIAKTIEKAQDIAATIKAVPKGKQTRRQFLGNMGEVTKRVAMKKKLPQKTVSNVTKSIGYVSDPKSLALDIVKQKTKGKDRVGNLERNILGLIGMSHKSMLLSNFNRKRI